MSEHDPYCPPQEVMIASAPLPPGLVRSRRVALALLILLAFSAHGAWLGEVLVHGWAGLTWVTYVHWAVPGAILGMIAWLVWVAGMSVWRSVCFTTVLIGFGVMGHTAYQWALFCYFETGSLGIPLVLTGPWHSTVVRLSILPLLLITAPAFFALVHWFTGRPTLRWAGIGTGLFVVSPLLGVLVMALVTPFADSST